MPMGPEVITAWLGDLHIIFHDCHDASTCTLPATARVVCTPTKKRKIRSAHPSEPSAVRSKEPRAKARKILSEINFNANVENANLTMASSSPSKSSRGAKGKGKMMMESVTEENEPHSQALSLRRSPRKATLQRNARDDDDDGDIFTDKQQQQSPSSAVSEPEEDDLLEYIEEAEGYPTPKVSRLQKARPSTVSRSSGSGYSRRLGQMQKEIPNGFDLPVDESDPTVLPPPAMASLSGMSISSHSSRHTSSSTNRTRSSSPMKTANDLLKLEKPVRWTSVEPAELLTVLDRHGNHDTSLLLGSVLSVTRRRAYLPLELRNVLVNVLALDVEYDMGCFEKKARIPVPWALLNEGRRAAAEAMFEMATAATPSAAKLDDLDPETREATLVNMSHLTALYNELELLQDIVSETRDFRQIQSTAEAAWNDSVHNRILQLATSSTSRISSSISLAGLGASTDSGAAAAVDCSVQAVNVTRASIAKPFIPPTREELKLDLLGSKMIDYVLVLRPDSSEDATGMLAAHEMAHFLSRQTAQGSGTGATSDTFNQSTYGLLCLCPGGVFIETKTETKRLTEAQCQLGVWVASWFGRVRMFQGLDDGKGGAPTLPVIPLLIVVAEAWELWFAVDLGDDVRVYGPVKCGDTASVDGAYQLLAVLRLLVGWMGSDFRRWVEGVMKG